MVHEQIKTYIERTFGFRLNKNQWKDIARLIFEITKRDRLTPKDVLDKVRDKPSIQSAGGRDKFFALKKALILIRYPESSKIGPIDTKKVFLPSSRPPLSGNIHPPKSFVPEKIFVEESADDAPFFKRLTRRFPHVAVEEIKSCGEYLRKHPFTLEDLKKPYLFIVKERWDFIKPCPCTRDHIRCNYWIFNVGMGCPFDCSYCFLQSYSNFPGIMLPSNLDDFFSTFDGFRKRTGKPIRIGTGEFCDSLALDGITGYASSLIHYFRGKDVLFELKTKSSAIEGVLGTSPGENIVISWSLNPQCIIDTEEMYTASLIERLTAAATVRAHGFSLGFHFDPIIHYPGWEKDYAKVVKILYDHVKSPFRWISLGTLRGNKKLKTSAERRFPSSTIFYGELLLGDDKKLRYPAFLRKKIYRKMLRMIRIHDTRTPVYLCMENKKVWETADMTDKSPHGIEAILTGQRSAKLKEKCDGCSG